MFGHQDDNTGTDTLTAAPVTEQPVDQAVAVDDSFNPALPPADAQPPQVATPQPAAAPAPLGTDTNSLLDIKQQALQQLTPLVGHLEQSPEEKFRTTMMMIQASDNQDLIQTAYEAAKSISDEKARAQALLDIVNEINYFTHQTSEA